MQEKYQVFISSTYTDLVKERECVQKTILSMEQFPSGMEMFCATDKEQWNTIKKKIDDADYYVLIIAHRYGSVIESGSDKGISYTEKEYRYAKSIDKPILVFIIDESVPVLPQNFERDGDKIKKLEEFKKEAMAEKVVEWWKNKDDLARKVVLALYKQIISEDKGENKLKVNSKKNQAIYVYGGQVNIATDNGKVEAIQNINNQGKVSEKNRDIDILKDISQILKDVYDELENVLCSIDKFVAYNCFYLDYKIIYEKGVMFVIEACLINENQDAMRNLFYDLWIKSFCEKGKNVDFRNIYILIYLLECFKVQIDFKDVNQKMEIPERIEYDSLGTFWKSKMESFLYLLERCPYIYENLNNGLKTKLKIVAEKNLGYIVREFYLYDGIDKHLEKIELERKAIYARQRDMSLYNRIWVSDNFIFLREIQQNDIDKRKIDKYVINLFCNSINFDMTESLWKYVKKYLSYCDTGDILAIIAAMDINSQIYERKKEPNIIKEFIENCNGEFDLSNYSNIKAICRQYGLLTKK